MDDFVAQWVPLLWFLLGFVSLILLVRWINKHLQGLLRLLGADAEVIMYLQFVVFAPGILIHEISHWLAAKALGVSTLGFSVWPRKKSKDRIQYGAVRIAATDIVRSSLIGLAPFLVASALIILIGNYALGAQALRAVVVQGQWDQLWPALADAVSSADFWLWLYLVFVISNAMFPSQADRESWRPLGLYLAIALALVYVSGWEPAMRTIPKFVSGITNPLIYTFGITAVVDLFFALVIGLAEAGIGALRGQRVQYRPPR